MLNAYDELERKMNELKNKIGRRIRDRTYAGARVIEIAPIAEVSANNYDAQLKGLEVNAQTGNACKRASETSPAEPANKRKEKIKTEKRVKAKKERKEVDREREISKRKDRKTKSEKSTRKSRNSSSTEEISEDNEPTLKNRSSSRKTMERSKKNISESESEEDNKERKKRKKEKERNEKHMVKKRRKLEFATNDSTGEERELPRKKRKHKAETDSRSATDGDDSGTSGSDVATKRKSEKEKQGNGRNFKKWLTLEKFDGTTPLSIFLNQLDTCAKYNGWDVEDKASHLRVSLKGNAAYIIDDENLEGASYQKLIKRLKSRFGTEGQSSLYRYKHCITI